MIMNKRCDHSGFTLVELVIVIVLIGILGGILFTILRGPMQAFVDVERRARLVDITETALQRMTREIRLAVPYSIRVSGSSNAVEFLRTFDGGRYRQKGAGRLRFNQEADTFTVFNTLDDPATINANSGTDRDDCLDSTAFCLVVFNIGQPQNLATAIAFGISANAYLGISNAFDGNLATISAATANSLSFDNNDGSPPASWDFGIGSPEQRFHIVDTVVSFVCSGGNITRFAGYPKTAVQGNPPALGANGVSNLLVDQVSACNFSLEQPTKDRFGLLTMSITINDATLGQSVSLLQQVHLDNLP